ncbi:uncharacterized protein B4U80_01379 [Leptotrombidium deliense]|uniref:C2H2-type domain-containing protein n=1 Tax=Leptotrombidium deliense TaxID=299467 RepID=A0A443SV29_9ACAR|nr:uncharacterized protein B4U80_01379 [Leptotrombidium deliense]
MMGREVSRRRDRYDKDGSEKAPLLDMLAEVASYTLNCQTTSLLTDSLIVDEPEIEKKSIYTLDQIRSLSDKNLVEIFSEFTADELRRCYRYRCCLLPDVCKVSFESFASEEKARHLIKTHLLNHISKVDQSFTAVVSCRRRKRRGDDTLRVSRSKSSVCFSKSKSFEKKNRKMCHSSPNKRMSSSNIPKEVKTFDSKKGVKRKMKVCESVTSTSIAKQRTNVSKRLKYPLFEEQTKVDNSCEGLFHEEFSSTNELPKNNYSVIVVHTDNIETNPDVNYELVTCEQSQAFQVFSVNIPLSSVDHSYTYAEGPKQPLMQCCEEFAVNINGNKTTNLLKLKTAISTPAFPYVYEPLLPNVCEVVEIKTSDLESNDEVNCEEVNVSDNVIFPKEASATNFGDQPLKRQPLGKAQWERDLALKYIEELRLKRHENSGKDSHGAVSRCQICNDKTFMSVSSLIYHYRGHAGIKPYECSICEATFTRQHSLNYHMLIHYNKTRFICEECGRHFRHPSHFKEHMRRHTGETPYECVDCSVKFKTRNTYKRHLQTKHGKILTAKGIYEAPNTESHLKKPCAPRRKYGLGYLHQNIEAIAQFEKAQKEFEKHEKASEDICRSHMVMCDTDNLDQLLQAAALAASDTHQM